jgi:hypothetical protein
LGLEFNTGIRIFIKGGRLKKMIPEEVLQSLAVQTESKLVMVVIDGIGGLPIRGKTELEAAKTPNQFRSFRKPS